MSDQTDTSRTDRQFDEPIRSRLSERAGITMMVSMTLLQATAISAFVLVNV